MRTWLTSLEDLREGSAGENTRSLKVSIDVMQALPSTIQ
ncbi:MAG: hypothetical protein AVDCRST_MAG44-1634 [uncultured Sphingomonas sp.]|uniref:Uncharacterized protein n=1 Tax=uncultured Sphingomonas sp. TaxID=158754 RepID=A0A6J4T6M0_9SPHN|nr:MAG: hypothetical protein AVDCRST_MAG44-1634 [uncultured Sphingomonas sp.]